MSEQNVEGFDRETGLYRNRSVNRGFPLGGIGSGGICIDADGWFGELRLNNNWMRPIRGAPGAFFALGIGAGQGGPLEVRVLRRARADEYPGLRGATGTTFDGRLPRFSLAFDTDLPVRAELTGFTPHVPHDVARSTMPLAFFRLTLENPAASDGGVGRRAVALFSFENVLGQGGTGLLGVDLGPQNEMRGVRPRLQYESVEGAFQEEARLAGRRGIRFRTALAPAEGSHRRSTCGEYLLLVDEAPGLEISVCDGWNARGGEATVLSQLVRDGRLSSPDSGRRGADGVWHPAAAVAAGVDLAAGERREIDFCFAWWTADHVTCIDLGRPDRPDAAVAPVPGSWRREGHVYEVHFSSLDDLATRAGNARADLARASGRVERLVDDSSLPAWLKRALANSIDSTLCNTVVPQRGTLHTLEGVDWVWPMGGLTGTNDQRLSAHPYTSVLFPELDASELEEFRRLADERGAIPHGNGNCDLGLGRTDVPYGWPMEIKGLLPAKEWTDLTMSLVIQVGKLWRITGDDALLERFWPALVRGLEYLESLAPRGVPEGGTTYDVWDFPGSFSYSATVHLATLATMVELARRCEPALVERYASRMTRCAEVLEGALWDPRGFYRSTETHETIFTAALAGDWAARYAGLAPVVDPARARTHLQHAHRVLVRAALDAAAGRFVPIPWSEASYDGVAVKNPMSAGLPVGEEMTYVWQVLSYQAMESIYLGLVAEGMETIELVYERLGRDGNLWSGGLRGNGESIYMTHPVLWALPNALTGAALDVPGRTLHLSPRCLEPGEALRCPVFFPPVWATVEYEPGSGHTSFEVVETFGPAVTIERVSVLEVGARAARVIEIAPRVLEAGRRIEFAARDLT